MNKQNKAKDLLSEEWVKKAEDDELNAVSILTHRDGTPGGVCFLAHQMAEKYLKAFIVSRKKEYPKIHFIDKLVAICADMDSSFLKLMESATLLDPFYTPTRYPGEYPEFIWNDAEKAMKAVREIKTFVLRKLG